MSSFNFLLLTIFSCGLVTWGARVLPFILLKRFTLKKRVVDYLSFVPVVILSSLWFSNIFIQHLGRWPSIDVKNLLASLPTILAAVWTKNLLVIVCVGMLSLAVLNVIF